MIGNLTEKQIEKLILQWLNAQADIFAFKINTVGIFDTVRKVYRKNLNPHVHVGTSDIVGCCRGFFFAFEVKTPSAFKRKIPDAQARFIDRVRLYDGMAHVVCSLEQVEDHISLIRKRSVGPGRALP
jgi:penicillin-binding protein-related factor A (putative recombinase)